MKIFRSILAVVLALVASVLVVSAADSLTLMLFERPAGMDVADPESIRQHMGEMPVEIFVTMIIGWTLGSFSGSVLASSVAAVGKRMHGWVMGGFTTLGVILNALLIPHPIWVVASGILCTILATLLGSWMGSGVNEAKKKASDEA